MRRLQLPRPASSRTQSTPPGPSSAAPQSLTRRWWAATSLCVLGLSGLSCAADVPKSNPGSGVIALFNPSVSPPVVPAPTDLVRVGGSLQIPVDPDEATNGALKTFNDYLRSLDGFPPDSTATTSFSGAVDPTSLAESLVVYDATAQKVVPAANISPALDSTTQNKVLSVNTTTRWQNGHTYLVGLFNWSDSTGSHGVRGADGNPVISDTAFAYLRSTTPLYGHCQDATNPACVCSDLTDTSCHAIVDGLSDSQALQLEPIRQGIKPLIDAALAAKGRQRQELVLAWSFTISARTFATFDAARGNIPFPSNLLLKNRGLGAPGTPDNVNLTILPTDDARTQALKGGLNTLDGFTTTGSVQYPIDSAVVNGKLTDIDVSTLVNPTTQLPTGNALLLNLSVPTKQPTYSIKSLQVLDPVTSAPGFGGQIWLTPKRPLLSDLTTYASVLTTLVKDTNGQYILPAPATLLLTQTSPLVSADGTTSLVPAIPLAEAQQLEALRTALNPLFMQFGALGIPRANIAAFTAYRTQSVVAPIAQLLAGTAQLAGLGAIPTGVTIKSVTTAGLPPTLGNLSAIVHGLLTVRRVVDIRGPFNTTRLAPAASNNDVIPFMMTLPTKALAPAGGAPIAIGQHGLTSWRGDMLALANTLAGQGQAMLSIDVIYHGGRVICLKDADCATGVTCDLTANQCTGGAYLPDPTASAIPGTTAVRPSPTLPNRDFTNLTNPFALRDNFRQHNLDLFQLVRVIKDVSGASLKTQLASNAALPPIDATKIVYVGQSLGAILGTNFLAMSPSVNVGVLNVGGGDLVDILSDPNSVLSAGVATSLGVTPGTAAYFSLLENFRWIVDPADPLNYGRYVRTPDPAQPARTAAKVILQEAGLDKVISNQFTQALGVELGLPLDASFHLQGIDKEGTGAMAPVSTFFATADHSALLNFTVPATTVTIQNQAAIFLKTGLAGTPTVQ